LYAVDRLPRDRIEALHAKAGPVDPSGAKGTCDVGGQAARIDLDRDVSAVA
jgi:hypothetical protein